MCPGKWLSGPLCTLRAARHGAPARVGLRAPAHWYERLLGLSATSFVRENGCQGPFVHFGRLVQGPSGHPGQGPSEPLHIDMKIRFLNLSGTSFVRKNGCRGPLHPSGGPSRGLEGDPGRSPSGPSWLKIDLESLWQKLHIK